MFVEIFPKVSFFVNLLSHHDGFQQLSRVHFITRPEKFLLPVQDQDFIMPIRTLKSMFHRIYPSFKMIYDLFSMICLHGDRLIST